MTEKKEVDLMLTQLRAPTSRTIGEIKRAPEINKKE